MRNGFSVLWVSYWQSLELPLQRFSCDLCTDDESTALFMRWHERFVGAIQD
jgi:hypothetical protein